MKILCIADIHGDIAAVERAKKFAHENAIRDIIILGDFQGHRSIGGIDDAEKILNMLKDFNLFVIPGNCDSQMLVPLLSEAKINLHEEILEIPETNVKIVGIGGSIQTEYDTPFELEEEYIYDTLKNLLSKRNSQKKFILATHCPPKYTKCDLTMRGSHNGSEALRKIIEEFQPELVLSSHVHESAGNTDTIGKTRIANIGKLSDGNLAVLEITDDITVKLHRL